MFILYGVSRLVLEFLRDDNPFEYAGLTISQLIGIGMIALGVAALTLFQLAKGKQVGN
jgi:prolipoprotein diacylglyceryltransferase